MQSSLIERDSHGLSQVGAKDFEIRTGVRTNDLSRHHRDSSDLVGLHRLEGQTRFSGRLLAGFSDPRGGGLVGAERDFDAVLPHRDATGQLHDGRRLACHLEDGRRHFRLEEPGEVAGLCCRGLRCRILDICNSHDGLPAFCEKGVFGYAPTARRSVSSSSSLFRAMSFPEP